MQGITSTLRGSQYSEILFNSCPWPPHISPILSLTAYYNIDAVIAESASSMLYMIAVEISIAVSRTVESGVDGKDNA